MSLINSVKIGVYCKHLENWLKYFPLKNFLFISGERLIVDPAAEMNRVQVRFLIKSYYTLLTCPNCGKTFLSKVRWSCIINNII
jgi:Sulfotransferase domain